MKTQFEGDNPFDKHLSPDTKQRVEELKEVLAFEKVQAAINVATQESFKLARLHDEQWTQVQEHQHEARLQQAEAEAPIEVRENLQANQEEQDRLDDIRFSWMTCRDHLLQLRGHEDYLRARRSFERRPQPVVTKPEAPKNTSWTGERVWAIGTFVVTVFLILGALSETVLGGLILGCVLLPLWALVAQAPNFLKNFGSGSYGRGGSGAI